MIDLSKFQLMLAHVDHPAYVHAYARACDRRDYIVMDNGAAELGGSPFSEIQLVNIATQYRVDELVLPDAPYNARKTVNLVHWALMQYRQLPAHSFARTLNYMAVAQGRTMEEVKYCVKKYAEIEEVTVIGIPRLLITNEYATIRIDVATWIEETYPKRFKIHFLGTSPLYVREVRIASRYVPHVRSVDTSMPFNYAIYGYDLRVASVPPVKRPSDYFTNVQKIDNALLKRNIETIMGWANEQAPTG